METVWTVLAIAGVMGLFAFFWYAVKRRVMTRARQEVGLPAEGAEAARAAGKTRLPPTSLVLLSREARPLSRELVGAAVRRAWGVEELSDEETAESHWVFGQTEQLCTVSVKGTVYTVVSLLETYKQDRDWYVGDETAGELVSAWQQHRAWVSVDLAFPGPMMELAAALDQIGKLVAELADGETVAVVRPATRHVVVWDEKVRRLLRRRPAAEVVTGAITSLVILQRERRAVGELGAKGLAAKVRAAWAVELPVMPAGPGGDFCAVSSERGGMGFVQYEGIRFGVMTPEGAYGREGDERAEGIGNRELREKFSQHGAWTAVDLMAAPVGVTRQRVYALMGKLAAELLDERALLLVAPALGRVVAIDEVMVAGLRGEDALAALLELRGERG
jgi:hypothetical protein